MPSAEAHEKALATLYPCLWSDIWEYEHDWSLEIDADYCHPDGIASFTSYIAICECCGAESFDDRLIDDLLYVDMGDDDD